MPTETQTQANEAPPVQGKPLDGSDHRLVRAFARARKDGWPRCPKCGKRLRPYEGNMRDVGTSRPQQWQCDSHFLPSYWGTAKKLVDELNSPNKE